MKVPEWNISDVSEQVHSKVLPSCLGLELKTNQWSESGHCYALDGFLTVKYHQVCIIDECLHQVQMDLEKTGVFVAT